MLNKFKAGDTKTFTHVVNEADIAKFSSGTVHNVYATFALGRDAEWASRQFVLEMKEEHEEGIGTMLTIEHQSPAMLGDKVVFEAIIEKLERNELICTYTAKVNERVIAIGTTGQKILKKEKLKALFAAL